MIVQLWGHMEPLIGLMQGSQTVATDTGLVNALSFNHWMCSWISVPLINHHTPNKSQTSGFRGCYNRQQVVFSSYSWNFVHSPRKDQYKAEVGDQLTGEFIVRWQSGEPEFPRKHE
ncbi:uncharacterized protein LOC125026172 [Penaeus chinensis]|uniref:uncharacterized protein LOC125026172 n=1 Tax=Penaeus chinensis TaxID=139456 RepID=UPI001FB8300B|nr:uncharacterized protein LOC125026172 [Penaeus chinensis]